MKVSFDYDGTLDRKDVQGFCRKLIRQGVVEVWVCTMRTKEYNDVLYKIADKSTPPNNDLFAVTDDLGIPRERIIFTEMQEKSDFLNGKGFVWHLDDDWTVLKDLELNSDVKGIDVRKSFWKNKGMELIKEKQCCGNWDEFGVCKCSNFVKNEK